MRWLRIDSIGKPGAGGGARDDFVSSAGLPVYMSIRMLMRMPIRIPLHACASAQLPTKLSALPMKLRARVCAHVHWRVWMHVYTPSASFEGSELLAVRGNSGVATVAVARLALGCADDANAVLRFCRHCVTSRKEQSTETASA